MKDEKRRKGGQAWRSEGHSRWRNYFSGCNSTRNLVLGIVLKGDRGKRKGLGREGRCFLDKFNGFYILKCRELAERDWVNGKRDRDRGEKTEGRCVCACEKRQRRLVLHRRIFIHMV